MTNAEQAVVDTPSRGNLDVVAHGRITGWTWNGKVPDGSEVVIVAVGERVVARVLADRYRGDLAAAGIGNGRHAFELVLDPTLDAATDHVVSARREHDGSHLAGSPSTLRGGVVLDASEKNRIAALIATFCDGPELDARLSFLTDQIGALRRRRAASLGGSSHVGAETGQPEAGRPRRALVIDDAPPRRGHDAGSNAVLSHIDSLRRLGLAVTFVPADMRYSPELEARGVECCGQSGFGSVEEVLRLAAGRFDLVYLHRVSNASRYTALVREHQPRARLVYSVADLHHLRLARQAEVEGRPELARYGQHVRSEELAAAARADAVITHSSAEAMVLRRALPGAMVHVVPWAVPSRPTAVPFAERRGLAFVAHYGHKPNVDAAHWLVEAVLPALARLGRALPCLLVGTAMPDDMRRLARESVEIVGAVDDLDTVFDRVRLTVAPLAYGAGLKGKVLDSLAAGVPCVCTPVAAEGLHLPAPLGEQVGDTAEEFAASILRVHDDPALNAACRSVGLSFVAAFASEANVDGLMREVVGDPAG